MSVIKIEQDHGRFRQIVRGKIKENLRKMQATMIISAHRLSTIMHADLILVLDGGAVAERGDHQSLLARGGLYAELIDAQLAMDSPAAPLSPERGR